MVSLAALYSNPKPTVVPGVSSPATLGTTPAKAWTSPMGGPAAPGSIVSMPPEMLARIEAQVQAMEAGNNTQAYDQAYSNAMAAARANITSSIGNALTEIANRQSIANQGLQQLPGQLNTIYDQAKGQVTAGADNLLAQQKASGQSSFLSAEGSVAPGLTAMANANAGAVGAVPTLQLAFDNSFGEQRQAASASAAGSLASLDAEAAMHTADMEKDKADRMNSTRRSLVAQWYEANGYGSSDAQKVANDYAAEVVPGYASGNGKALVKNLPEVAAQIKDPQSGGDAYKAYNSAYQALQSFHDKFGNRPGAKYPDEQKKWDKAWKQLKGQFSKQFPNEGQAVNLALYDAGA